MALILALSLTVPWAMRGKRILPDWLHHFLTGHTELLFVGLILGPGVLGLFDHTLIDQMRPFLTVGLGWVGLFFGLQWDFSKIRLFARVRYLLSAGQALLTAAIVTGAMALTLLIDLWAGEPLLGGVSVQSRLLMAALLGVVACGTAPIGMGWLIMHRGARGKNTELSQFLAATDGVISILLFGLVLSALKPEGVVDVPGLRALSNLALSLGLGLVLGWLGHFILRPRWAEADYFLWLIGLVVFSSGIAHAVGQSPLVINFVMGVILVNLSHQSARVTRSLGVAETPFYLLFLLLAGASWSFDIGLEWVLIVPYIVIRIFAKLESVRLAERLWPVGFEPRRDLGMTMLSQGGIELTMMINVMLLVPEGAHMRALQSLVIVSIVLNQMLGPPLAMRPLRLAGELRAARPQPA
jgi:hypothetical protein